MIVSKFGGKATTCKEAILNIKKLSANKKRKILVFSAVGKLFDDHKLTDLFISFAKAYRTRQPTSAIKKEIVEKLSTLCALTKVKFNVENAFTRAIVEFIQTENDDFLVSRGEYFTALIMSKFLKVKFVPSEKLLFFKNNLLDEKKSKQRISFYLKRYPQIVTTGFYGVNENNKIFLFPRGGGDLSGAFFASLCKAKLYENWTDIDGVREVNPQVCISKKVEQMSFDELEFISNLDANIIHKDCAKILKKTNTKLLIASIFEMEKKPTIVTKNSQQENVFVCFSVAANNAIVYLKKQKTCQKFIVTKDEFPTFVCSLYKKEKTFD